MEISQDEVKLTVERPDRMMDCDNCRKCFYIKKFRGKGELLVMAEKDLDKGMVVKCFGWLQNMFYAS